MYTRIGPYQPLKKIATGGMADVLLANKIGTPNRLFALKVLLAQYGKGSTVYKNFVDEAAILVEFDDLHIVKTYAYGDDFSRPYFVMEYIHGLSGAELMFEARRAKKMVPLGLSLGIIRTIAIALDKSYTAHNADGIPRNIIHNDVSPHNFQVGFDGSIKLLDYGVAIHQKTKSVSSRRGKFAYMSPESIRKMPLDNRSDLFSLGVSLYEMVVHRRAFKAKTPEETMARVLAGDLKKPRELSASFPPALEAIIVKATASAPKDRFQSGRELANAIEEFAASQNLSISQSSQKARLDKILGALISERNKELERLSREVPTSDQKPVTEEISTESAKEVQSESSSDNALITTPSPLEKVEVEYLQLPTAPLKIVLGILLIASIATAFLL
jgi:eukaryotic-like serine/threonine-protein kinase